MLKIRIIAIRLVLFYVILKNENIIILRIHYPYIEVTVNGFKTITLKPPLTLIYINTIKIMTTSHLINLLIYSFKLEFRCPL